MSEMKATADAIPLTFSFDAERGSIWNYDCPHRVMFSSRHNKEAEWFDYATVHSPSHFSVF